MMGMRRGVIVALIYAGLVVAVTLLAASGCSRSDAEQGASAVADVASAAGEDLPDAVTADALQGAALIDINTGNLVDALNVGADSVVRLAPGDIKGLVVEPDGVTPHAGIRAVLLDASTGKEVMSSVTNARGEYVLTNVLAGRYVVRAGNPGLGAVLVVSEQSEARVLDFLMSAASIVPSPPGVTGPRDSRPVMGTPVVKEDGTTLAAPVAGAAGDDDDDELPGKRKRKRKRKGWPDSPDEPD